LSRNYTTTSKSSSSHEHVKEDHQGPWSSDFVQSKGGGQIILLHGKPGVGKTTTAECIAELSHRPLLAITCGDLGTYSSDIQQELERWLHLGTLWKCVLLFDEADVFLESRAHGDIERNSIVSVFLRAIEYYTGLMFLTTNRIGSFDEAVLSRIHAVLHLPNLTTDDRKEIWDTSFRKLADERSNIKVDFSLMNYAYNDEKIRRLNWNGREIRNAFNTMIALAEWDAQHNDKYTKEGKVLVTRLHLEEVATMSGTFKSYLEDLRGMTDDEHMRSQGIRGT
jgi:SpoVK/Ycf46/Vps4 family AAA+-type ATPase